MKFSLVAITGLAGALGAAAASLPKAFTLVADGGFTLQTNGQYVYYNASTTDTEILIFNGSGQYVPVSFTSTHETPTGWQNLYVIENSVSPVGLNTPHSGSVPEGGNMSGFGVNDEGHFTHNGNAYFAIDGYGSEPTKQVYWYGAHNSEYKAVNLWVKEFRE